MNKEIIKMLNTQIQKEFESAYIYLGFASYLESRTLPGFAKWYKVQAREEENHAMRFYDYLQEKNEEIKLLPVGAPDMKVSDVGDILELSLEHEKYITALIDKIYSAAQDAKDYSTESFLNWFITEQREEELNAQNMIDIYRMYGKSPEGLYLLDKEFGARK